jgi:hypothetical protein
MKFLATHMRIGLVHKLIVKQKLEKFLTADERQHKGGEESGKKQPGFRTERVEKAIQGAGERELLLGEGPQVSRREGSDEVDAVGQCHD